MCSGLRGGRMLGGAGVLIGNACWGCPWDGWSEPPIIWIADVGNPSSGKSPGLDAIRDVIGLIESGANEDHKDNLAGWDTNKRLAKIRLGVWEDACKTALKSKKTAPQRPKDADEPARPVRKRIITNDPTVEKVAGLSSRIRRGLCCFVMSSPAGLGRSTNTAAPAVIVPSTSNPMVVELTPSTE